METKEKKKKPPKQKKAGRRAGKKAAYDRYRMENRKRKNKIRRMQRTLKAQPNNEELRLQYLKT